MRKDNFISIVSILAGLSKKEIAISTLSGLIRIGAALSFVAVSKHMIDIATGSAEGDIWVFAILMAACVVIQLCFGAISTMVENRSEIVLRNTLRGRLFLHIVRGDWVAVSEYHSGDVVSRLNDDVATVTNMVCRDIPYALITIAQLLGATIFLLYLDIRLAAVIVVIMPISILVSRFYIQRMKSINSQLRTGESRLSVSVQEGVRTHTLIKTMSGYDSVADEYHILSDTIRRLTMRRTRLSLYSKSIIQAGFACGYTAAFIFGIYGLSNHAITYGIMTAFLQLVSQVQRPTLELSKIVPSIVRTMTATERIQELMDIPQEHDENGFLIEGKLGIRCKNISYKYPKSTDLALHDLSCDFRSGGVTAVVGKSGSGKTTMFRLLLGLITPTKGEITIYNEKIEYPVSESTRVNFSYVPQGNSLVSGSIWTNLMLGNPSADEKIISEALKTACAEFVYSLPGGLDFICEEDGKGLSEGQAQRIAIARGIIHQSRILLLDEPTSALDAPTSKKLLANLAQRNREKTIIIITHSVEVADLCQFKIELS